MISRTSQRRCQWRIQQSRFVSISHPSGWAQCTVMFVNCVKIGILCRAVSVGDCRGAVLGQADHPPGPPECGPAWQNSRELPVASLGGPCSGTHWELREAQGGQALGEDLGTWSGPSVQARQLFKVKIVIWKVWLNIQLIVRELALLLSPTDILTAFKTRPMVPPHHGSGWVGCLEAATASA